MASPNTPVIVYDGPAMRGREVWSFLRGHGIEARMLDQHAALGYGLDELMVVVPETEWESALELLRELGELPEPGERPVG